MTRCGSRLRAPVVLFLIAALALPSPAWGRAVAATTTERISVSSAGVEGNRASWGTSISADGRFVAFESWARTLVGTDTNGTDDVFVRDRRNGTTERVSVSSAGVESNDRSSEPSISANGRFVAFSSSGSNLVENDNNRVPDIFVRDRRDGTTTRISVSSASVEANLHSYGPSISANGRFVAFYSYASNLVRNDHNRAADVFVRDLRNGTTTRISVSSAGIKGNSASYDPAISANGRFVAFWSVASNLVENDTNGTDDVFVHDRRNGTTERVSVSSAGVEGNDRSSDPSISASGRLVAFSSYSKNLVENDTDHASDIFVHDRKTRTTTRVSASYTGLECNGGSYGPSISADGRSVAFWSSASNLVRNDTNIANDVFVRDRTDGTTTLISATSAGSGGNASSYDGSISADGRFVTFWSYASNLVENDTNGRPDDFVRGPLARS